MKKTKSSTKKTIAPTKKVSAPTKTAAPKVVKPSAKNAVSMRRERMFYCAGMVLVAICFLAAYQKIFDYKLDMNGDNINYYSLGNALAQGKGYSNIMGYEETPHAHYPPGYPAIVSVGVRMGLGTTGIKLINGILMLLSLLVAYRLFFKITKNTWITTAAALLCALNANLLRSATIMMSEIPCIFFTLLAILMFVEVVECTTGTRKCWLYLAVAAACALIAYFVRTQAMTLVAAMLFALLVLMVITIFIKRKESLQLLWQANKIFVIAFAAIAIVFFAGKKAWDMRNASHGYGSSNYVGQISYLEDGSHITDRAGWIKRLKANTQRYIAYDIAAGLLCTPVKNYREDAAKADWVRGAVLCLLMLLGVFALRKQHWVVLFYVGATAVVLWFWPEFWYGVRFMTPVIPLLILLFVMGTTKSFYYIGKLFRIKERFWNIVIPIAVVCFTISKYSPAIAQQSAAAKSRVYTTANASPAMVEFIDAIKWCKQNTPDTARIASRKPEIFYAYSGGRKCMGFPKHATPEAVVELFQRQRVDYVIIDRWFSHGYTTIIPAAQKYPQHFFVAHQIGGTTEQEPPTYVLRFVR